MLVEPPFVLTLLAALGCALIGGVFFAFSNFVMKALSRLSPASGVTAMQAINGAALNSLFLALFLGTAGACTLLVVHALTRWRNPGSAWLLAGGAAYLACSLAVTLAFNVPRDDALARLAPSDGKRAWRDYLCGWTRWNHVRTIAAVAAAALLMTALAQLKT